MKTKMLVTMVLGFVFLCGFSSERSVITGLCEITDPMAYELPIIGVGTPLEEDALPSEVECTVEGREIWDTYFCPVIWEEVSMVDTSVPGRKTITGILAPTEEYVLSEEINPEVSCSVFVTAEGIDRETLESVECSGGNNLLPVGGSVENLNLDRRRAVCYTTNFGEYFFCPVEWDCSGVDTWNPGTYIVTGAVGLPEGFGMPPEMENLTLRVGVAEEDKVDLSAVLVANQEQIICQWIRPVDPMTVTLEYAVDDEGWKVDPCWENGSGLYGYVWERMLVIHTIELEQDRDYYFRIGMDGTYSHALYIRNGREGLNVQSDAEREDIVPSSDGTQDLEYRAPAVEAEIMPEIKEIAEAASVTVAKNAMEIENPTYERTAGTERTEETEPKAENEPVLSGMENTETVREALADKETVSKVNTADKDSEQKLPLPGKSREIVRICMIVLTIAVIIAIFFVIVLKYLIFNNSWIIMKYKNSN